MASVSAIDARPTRASQLRAQHTVEVHRSFTTTTGQRYVQNSDGEDGDIVSAFDQDSEEEEAPIATTHSKEKRSAGGAAELVLL